MLYIHLDKLYIKLNDQKCKKLLKLIDYLKIYNIDIQFNDIIYIDKDEVPNIISNEIVCIGLDECILYIKSIVGDI